PSSRVNCPTCVEANQAAPDSSRGRCAEYPPPAPATTNPPTTTTANPTTPRRATARPQPTRRPITPPKMPCADPATSSDDRKIPVPQDTRYTADSNAVTPPVQHRHRPPRRTLNGGPRPPLTVPSSSP